MNNNISQGNWKEIKGKIKEKWGKFNDDEIETLNGHLDQLSGKIQKTYGYAKEKAETEYQDFTKSIAEKTNKIIEEIKK